MKKLIVLLAMVFVFGVVGTAHASLTTIGTASYLGNNYNLIYEDDSIDGGLVWLDYERDWDDWQIQVDWASGLGGDLTVNLDPGYTTDIDWGTGWRLPLTQDQTEGYYKNGSEWGHLYYDSLGRPAGGPLGDANPFNNLQSHWYWSGTEISFNPEAAWLFDTWGGYQGGNAKFGNGYALAVHPGTVSGGLIPAVPIPSAIWLLGSGLIGLVGFRRKIRK